LDAKTITNGAFRITSVAKDGISLERNPDYWNQAEVKLEKVKFIPSEDAENALAAYRAGEIDAITNASFQPLALKLLQPFDEFHQTVHGALNYYEFNLNSKPFDDFRVRKALAISIDRKRLTEDEMDGATEPALNFLPFETKNEQLKEDVEKAKKLLGEAGFSNGENFPVIRLLVNRNNMQQKIAKSVAKMWQKNLNIRTEIIVKDKADFENSLQIGDYNLARRGVVLSTHNEIINMLAMFENKNNVVNQENTEITPPASNSNSQILDQKTAESNLNFEEDKLQKTDSKSSDETNGIAENKIITTEEEALRQIPAIPLYYPTSYSLVKPYIKGFELNVFDALSLKNVEIDNDWQPKDSKNISNSQNTK
jgi:oligopeptide transport system substrate-binding protein